MAMMLKHGQCVVGVALVCVMGGARVRAAERPSGAEPHPAEDEALEQEHAPRHGGFFGDADDQYHYELVLEPSGRLQFYVSDEYHRPLDVRALQGRWTLNPGAPISLSGVFTPAADGGQFTAELPLAVAPAGAVQVEVAVLKAGQWVAMEFQLPRPIIAAASEKRS
jgi:hypothetical protein